MKIAGCFLEYDGKFVILLRHSHKPNGGTWGLPAGKVEDDETYKAAVLREVLEETGYAAEKSQLDHLGDFPFGQEQPYIFATYRIKLNEPHEITLDDAAHAEAKWVTGEECYALTNLIPDFHELLKLVGYVK